MITYRLHSSPAICTPGIVAWAINGYGFERDREPLLNALSNGFPDVPRPALEGLLSKALPYTVEGETVIFTAPETFPAMTCRKCGKADPLSYFAPVVVDGTGTCICFDCAEARHWLDRDGNLRPGVEL